MSEEVAPRAALVEMRSVSKHFGSVNALRDVSLEVHAGEVTCVLGDNGAGKSTLIKVLSGVFPPDSGEMVIDGTPVHFASPRVARSYGIATVFQDLATVPLMSLWRNFFLGNEPTRGRGRCGGWTSAAPSRSCTKRWPKWASMSATPTNRWGRFQAGSARP